MRVLFVTSECTGIYKVGGLGDVSQSLPTALSRLGIEISLAMPYYQEVRVPQVRSVGQVAVDVAGKKELVFVFRTNTPQAHVPVYLFRHPKLASYRSPNLAATFAFFSKAVAQFHQFSTDLFGGPYTIVHCNDWHTSLIPLLLGANVRTVLTVHNFLYQGAVDLSVLTALGINPSLVEVTHKEKGQVKLLHEGIRYAGTVTTVSPTYAWEVAHKDKVVARIFKKRGDRLTGILNGIDGDLWNPATDRSLPRRFSMSSLASVRPKIKATIQKRLRLPLSDVPLFAFIGRLERRQKGIDLIEGAIRVLPKNRFQLVILGTGMASEIKKIQRFVATHRHIRFIAEFNEPLARLLYAGSDVMLVPSKFEPCGLVQMIAMRYGALPLVRKTGGLSDTVRDGSTGFVFVPYRASSLIAKMIETMRLFQGHPEDVEKMRKRAMREDFSWKKQASRYIELYKSLT